MMKCLPLLVLFLLSLLFSTGCSDPSVVIVEIPMADHYFLENRELSGRIDIDSSMTLASVSVDVLDENLKTLRTIDSNSIEISQWYNKKDRWSFQVSVQDYESSYIRFSYTCLLGNGDSATFTEYVDILWEDGFLFNLVTSLKKYRVETLVKKEKMPLYLAHRLSGRDLLEFFSMSPSMNPETQESNFQYIGQNPYLYGGYYLENSHFIENFDKISKGFDRAMSGKSFSLDSVKALDNAVFIDDIQFLYSEPRFESIYGFPKCDNFLRDSVVKNKVKNSYYKDSLFRCDSGRWRLEPTIIPADSDTTLLDVVDSAKLKTWCLDESRVVEIGELPYSVAYDSLCSTMFIHRIDSVNVLGGGFVPYRVLNTESYSFMMDYLVDSLTLVHLNYWYKEHPTLSWNEAENSCPEGFHVPDTLEFKNHEWLFDGNQLGAFEDASVDKERVEAFALFWTSNAKNSGIRYCARLSFYDTPLTMLGFLNKSSVVQPYVVDFVECPADVDMVVQVACVKSLEKK